MKLDVILIGSFTETIEIILSQEHLRLVGVIDKSPEFVPDQYKDILPYLGNDNIIETQEFCNTYSHSHLVISPDLPGVRKKLCNQYLAAGFKLINVISPKANVSPTAKIEECGSIIIQGLVNVSSNVRIGKCVKINVMANIMHDCVLGDFTTIAPNAVLLGGVVVGDLSYIGANATILPGVHISKGVIIGAGAVVTKNVPGGSVFAGNPAREMKRKVI